MIDDIGGMGFPFRIDPQTGGVAWAFGKAKLQQNIRILLATRQGERPMLRDFGTRIHALVHEPNDDVLADLVRTQAQQALLQWEPRVLVTGAEIVQTEDSLQLKLAYAYTSAPEAEVLSVPLR